VQIEPAMQRDRWSSPAWSGCPVVFSVLLSTLAFACTTGPEAKVDVGPSVASISGVFRLAFTPDGTRLVYQTDPAYGGSTATLGVLDLASGSTRNLPVEVTFFASFEVTADGQAVLVTEDDDPDHRLLRVALDGTTPPVDLAHDVRSVLTAPQPAVVATVAFSTDDLRLLDTAAGTSRVVGQGWPREYSPDGAALVVSVPRVPTPTDGGPSDDYQVVDLAAGTQQSFLAPDLSLGPVLAWTDGRPQTVAAQGFYSGLVRVDVATDTRLDLMPEQGTLTFLASTSAGALIAATEVCLQMEQDFEGDFCAAHQTTFWRIDPASAAHEPVASTPEPVVAAVSLDGARLALIYGGQIHLKDLR